MRTITLIAAILLLAISCDDEPGRGPDAGVPGDGPVGGDALQTDGHGHARDGRGPTTDGPASDSPATNLDGKPPADQGPPQPYCPQGPGATLKVGAGHPHATIAAALKVAKAGDTIVVADGTYSESLSINVGGTSDQARLTLCAEHYRKATITFSGRVLDISKPWVTVQGFVLDGQWGSKSMVQADDSADHLILRDLEIKNGTDDGIVIGGGSSGGCEEFLIEGCTIHHLLAGSTTNQQDAHCIVAYDFKNLTIRNTEAYYCSGDAVQVGTDREPWDGLLIEGCTFWTGPLPAAAAGFNKGEVPGENALDTKAEIHPSPWKGTILLRDSVFYGFDPKGAYIGNRAALNLKNQITGVVERCTLHDNEIGLRIRGAGTYGGVDGLVVKNTVHYRNQFHAQLEDDAKNVQFLHNTFGRLIDANNAEIPPGDPLYLSNTYKGGGGGHEGPGWVSDNNLFLASAKPQRATGSGDLATLDTVGTWVGFAAHDYHLKKQINAAKGVGVTLDRDKKQRSVASPDVGAYEL